MTDKEFDEPEDGRTSEEAAVDGGSVPEQEAVNSPDALAEAQSKAAEYLDMVQRLKADFDNYRRRSERELAESRKFGAAEFLAKLLAVVDNLERAAQSADDGPSLREGLQMTLKQMRTLLEREGVARIEALGQPFDPALHEALLTVAAPDQAPGTVAQVFEEGYKMGDRLLRPARVAVAEDQAGGEGTDG